MVKKLIASIAIATAFIAYAEDEKKPSPPQNVVKVDEDKDLTWEVEVTNVETVTVTNWLELTDTKRQTRSGVSTREVGVVQTNRIVSVVMENQTNKVAFFVEFGPILSRNKQVTTIQTISEHVVVTDTNLIARVRSAINP